MARRPPDFQESVQPLSLFLAKDGGKVTSSVLFHSPLLTSSTIILPDSWSLTQKENQHDKQSKNVVPRINVTNWRKKCAHLKLPIALKYKFIQKRKCLKKSRKCCVQPDQPPMDNTVYFAKGECSLSVTEQLCDGYGHCECLGKSYVSQNMTSYTQRCFWTQRMNTPLLIKLITRITLLLKVFQLQ